MADDRPTIDETLDRVDRVTTRPEQRVELTRNTGRPASIRQRFRGAVTKLARGEGRRQAGR